MTNLSARALPGVVAADLFTTEVWTGRGLVICDTMFVIELHSWRVRGRGATRHPDETFVVQAVPELTDAGDGVIGPGRILIFERDLVTA